MVTRCPAPPDLLLYAMQTTGDRQPRDVAHHVSRCGSCRATVEGIRDVAGELQSIRSEAAATQACLDEMTVANLAERGLDMAGRPDLVAHLAACALCRERVASVAHLLRDRSVAAEIGRAEVSAPGTTRRWRVAGAGALTALAAALALMVSRPGDPARVTQPLASAVDEATHREQSVTTTAAPNLIAPAGTVAAADTFRWSNVPHADRYRLTLYDRDATVVWEAEGSDTAMVTPPSITLDGRTVYLWRVQARTGWDRWVASDLLEFSVAPHRRIP